MHFGTTIELLGWRDGAVRPGLDGVYKQANFRVNSDGIPPFEVSIYVHSAWPKAEAEKVARSFLAARLAEAASTIDAYTPAELDNFWKKVRPVE